MLVLKRFDHTRNFGTKLTTVIKYGMNVNLCGMLYELRSIVVHKGPSL